MVLGVFSNTTDANEAVRKLEAQGYNPKNMSIIMKEDTVTSLPHTDHVTDTVATGVTAGGALGALAGLLIGIGALAVPGAGALLIGGPIAAALGLTGAAATTVSGAVTGALAGGLVSGLVGLGIPEPEAAYYESQIKAGAILLAVPTLTDREDEAREILEGCSATQIRSVPMHL